MRVLHLFAGAGGGVLADRLLGHTSVGYVEWDAYCQAVLKARQADGCIDVAPIFGDVREFVARGWAAEYRGIVDVVAGGFPCQPFSVAGKREGSADDRNMWPAFLDVVRDVRPRYVFAENVPGLLTWDGGSYFGKIVGSLAALGFRVRWAVLGADDVGAPHRRKRLWILADADGAGRQQVARGAPPHEAAHGRAGWDARKPDGDHLATSHGESVGWWSIDPADLPDAEDAERNGWRYRTRRRATGTGDGRLPAGTRISGPVESRVGRVAHGVADRVHRLRALGNGQVPAVAAAAWLLLGGPVDG